MRKIIRNMTSKERQRPLLMQRTLYRWCLSILILSALLVLASCDSGEKKQKTEKETPAPETKQVISHPKIQTAPDETIEKVYGWMDQETVLYSVKTKNEPDSEVRTWNMAAEKGSIFYQPTEPIIDVSISPDQRFVLLHTASSNDKAGLTILNGSGDVLYSAIISSVEVAYTWNSYEPGTLFVSGFKRDWTYTSYIIKPEKKLMEALDATQPFPQWGASDELWYLDWNENEPGLTAPLLKKKLQDSDPESLQLNVIYFQKLKDSYFTIRDDSESMTKAVYTFYNDDSSPLSSFTAPHLKNFSDWLIPYFDYNDEKKRLFTFVPDKAGEADQYDGAFSLVEFNWENGTDKKILADAANEPLSCSKDAQWCLYGNSLEKVIDLKSKKVYTLFST